MPELIKFFLSRFEKLEAVEINLNYGGGSYYRFDSQMYVNIIDALKEIPQYKFKCCIDRDEDFLSGILSYIKDSRIVDIQMKIEEIYNFRKEPSGLTIHNVILVTALTVQHYV
jgi:hypothetical protein